MLVDDDVARRAVQDRPDLTDLAATRQMFPCPSKRFLRHVLCPLAISGLRIAEPEYRIGVGIICRQHVLLRRHSDYEVVGVGVGEALGVGVADGVAVGVGVGVSCSLDDPLIAASAWVIACCAT